MGQKINPISLRLRANLVENTKPYARMIEINEAGETKDAEAQAHASIHTHGRSAGAKRQPAGSIHTHRHKHTSLQHFEKHVSKK